jgi:hypothetical protein
MTATISPAPRREPRATGGRPVARANPAAVGGRRVRLPEVALGVFLVAGCALVAVVWQRHANAAVAVVVAAHPIARGDDLVAADLGVAELSGDTAPFVPVAGADALVGQVALVDVAAGSPLTADVLSPRPALTPTEALSAVAVAAGDAPPDLRPTDQVRVVVATTPSGSGDVSTVVLDELAVVWSVDEAPDGQSTIVTLRGSLSLAQTTAGAGRVHLARVEVGS